MSDELRKAFESGANFVISHLSGQVGQIMPTPPDLVTRTARSRYPDPLTHREVTNTGGDVMRLMDNGEIWAKRPGSSEYAVMYNAIGVQSLLLIADLAQYPFQTAEGVPCTADGTVKPSWS